MQTVQPLITDIFRANVQYVIPKYQRNYVWDRELQWEPLWADVEAMCLRSRNQDSETHFLGALITKEIGTERNVTQWVVVDGQQRLTTLQLLLAAVHSVLAERGHENPTGQLEELIRNPDHSVVDPVDRLKILPKGRGYASLAGILRRNLASDSEEGEDQKPLEDGLSECYSYFRQRAESWLREAGENGPQELARCLQRGFQFVEIRLTPGQNEHAIFEALNARGEPLTEWEKTKNYLLSLAPSKEDRDGSRVYEKYLERFDEVPYWSEDATGPRFSGPRVDHYLRYFAQIALPLIAERGRYERQPLRQDWLYREFRHSGERGRLFHRDRDCYLALLGDLVEYSEMYEKVVTDAAGTLSELARSVLRHRAENRIDSLIPVMMVLLKRCGERPGFEICLRALDSFMMRRVVVNARNYGFDDDAFRLVRRVSACRASELPAVLVEGLSRLSGSVRWPGDPEVERALEDGEARAAHYRLRLLLEGVAAEMQDERREQGLPWRDGLGLTLEHVVPREWKEHWRTEGLRRKNSARSGAFSSSCSALGT